MFAKARESRLPQHLEELRVESCHIRTAKVFLGQTLFDSDDVVPVFFFVWIEKYVNVW